MASQKASSADFKVTAAVLIERVDSLFVLEVVVHTKWNLIVYAILKPEMARTQVQRTG